MSDALISRLANCRAMAAGRLPAPDVEAIDLAIAEIQRQRTACKLAADCLTEWKRDFPESWGLVDKMALSECARAAGA